ncbi:MAG TPA: hypothetical protein DDW45_02760 [Gammaproteobacteria bacterium]|nr:hypothetical protein [Gammaproteobacteria bacterium]
MISRCACDQKINLVKMKRKQPVSISNSRLYFNGNYSAHARPSLLLGILQENAVNTSMQARVGIHAYDVS